MLANKINKHRSSLPQSLIDAAMNSWQLVAKQLSAEQFSLDLEHIYLPLAIVSPDFFAKSCESNPQLLLDLLNSGELKQNFNRQQFYERIANSCDDTNTEQQLAKQLRQCRRYHWLRILWRSVNGIADLDNTLQESSDFAIALLHYIVPHLQQKLEQKHGMPRDSVGNHQQLCVIVAGKLGAEELNFSSDIDLILAYPELGKTDHPTKALSNEQFFTRLAQQLYKILHEVTADGFVFRVDLRLRPNGDSGPLVIHFAALEHYYQQQGRGWERYALVKAQIVSGDKDAKQSLRAILQPFVYRRYVDFSVIEALRSLKHLFQLETTAQGLANDLKRGWGGIRQIEFIAQTFQLIKGGQDLALQHPSLLKVLPVIAENNLLDKAVIAELTTAYRFFRQLENALQMVADRQIHQLPSSDNEQARIAFIMGYSNWYELINKIHTTRQLVQNHFSEMLATADASTTGTNQVTDEELNALWCGRLSEQSGSQLLIRLGFLDGVSCFASLMQFGRSRRLRDITLDARNRLDRILPVLIRTAGKSEQADIILPRLVNLLEAIARRSAYLALLLENPNTLAYLVKLFGLSAWIAEQVASHPFLLSELLQQSLFATATSQMRLRQQLQSQLAALPEPDLEQQLEALRHFKLCHYLRTAASESLTALPLMEVSNHLSHLAGAILRQLLQLVRQDMQTKLPADRVSDLPDNEHFAVVAYGKLGGLELSYGSDLDLVFLHQVANDQLEITLRFAQRMINLLNLRTPSGILYQIDTRLRPSGAAGLLVSHIDAYADYQQHKAWTWEHQALVRARLISGSQQLQNKFQQIRHQVLCQQRDINKLRADVSEMRQKIHDNNPADKSALIDIKHVHGGIIDIEFLVQYAILAHAANFPEITKYTDNIRLLDSLAEVGIIAKSEAKAIQQSYIDYRQYQHQCLLQSRDATVSTEQFTAEREQVLALWQKLFGTNTQ